MLFDTFCNRNVIAMPVGVHSRDAGATTACNRRRLRILTLRVMKLSTIIILACCLQISAKTFSQTITYTSRSTSLPSIFKAIKQQTGYVVFYDQNIVDQRSIAIEATNEPLEVFIRKALKGTALAYAIQDKTIVISRKGSMVQVMDDIQQAAAYPQPIIGRLVDDFGHPIGHATVTLQPLGKTTVTTNEGAFSFSQVPPGKYILTVTHVAYNKVEKHVKMGTDVLEVTITATMAQQQLSGVEVAPSTGYQTIDRTKATGSYTVITAKEIEANPSVNLAERLEGRVPGVHFNLANNSIQIRGDNNFNAGSSSPLIVIDGFPAIEQNLSNYPGGPLGGANAPSGKAGVPVTNNTILSIFNPANIQSITFLKDAAAASIWGARAANGVIVIETKKGQKGRTVINVNSTLTLASAPDMDNINMMSSRQYVDYEKELFNDGYYKDYGYYPRNSPYSEAVQDLLDQQSGRITQQQLDDKLNVLSNRNNIGQIKKYLLQQAMTQQYNLSLSGGSDNSSYYIAGNYTSNKPVFKENTSSTYNILANLTNDFFDKKVTFQTGINVDYGDRQVNSAAQEALSPGLTGLRPYEMLVDANGNYLNRAVDYTPRAIDSLTKVGYIPWYYNSGNQLQSSNVFHSTATRFTEQIRAKITPWLTLQGSGMYQRNLYDGYNLQKVNSYNVLSLINTGTTFKNGKPTYGVPYGDILYTSHTWSNDYSLRGQFNIDKAWKANKHHVSMIGGSEIRQSMATGYNQAHYGFNEDTYSAVPVNPTGTYTTIWGYQGSIGAQSTSLATTKARYLSYFSNASYSFLNKYFVSGSLRFDDHNLVGVERRKRATPLWSGGLRWNAKEEHFMSGVKWLDNLAVRGSIGTGGNIPGTATPFAIVSTINPNPPSQPLQGTSVINPANRDLTWATTRTLNFGIDASLFKNHLYVTADIYSKHTSGLIWNLPVNGTYGWSSLAYNAANLNGHGVELNLTGILIRNRNWTLTSNFNFTYSASKVTDDFFQNTATEATASAVITKGYPVDNLFLYRWAGLDNQGQSQIYDAQHKIISSNDDSELKPEDRVYAGRTTPAYFGGFSAELRYKQFTINATTVYNMGYKVLRQDISNSYYPSFGNIGNFLPSSKLFATRWQKPGDEAHTNVPGIEYSSLTSENRYMYSTANVIDGGNIRLQMVGLTYSLPSAVMNHLRFARMVSFRVSADNLGLIWRANKDHIDPDYMFAGSYTAWPPVKNYAFNLNVTF